nr:hypothetical protein [Tanacetum cinerariifolium]
MKQATVSRVKMKFDERLIKINQGVSTTYFSSSNPLLEEFADELPLKYDDNLQFDIESDVKDIEFLLYQDKNSSLKDSIDQKNLANLADIFVDSIPEMFTDEHALIKESKLLIDELDLSCDFLPPFEYDSFISLDFSRVDALPSTNNEDKIFNPGILIQEKPVEIITRVVQDKKLAISNASLPRWENDPGKLGAAPDLLLILNMRHDTLSYSNQPQKKSINLINVFNNSSEDFLEDLFSDQPSGNPTFSSHLELTSPKVNNDIFDSDGCNVLSEKLVDLDSTKDLHLPLHDNPLSGSTTCFSSSNPLLEEFADELPPKYDDNLQFDIDSDLKDIEFLLYQDKNSSLKDSIDQKNLANLADIFVDSIPEMFTDEHALDYSSPPIIDEYNDDFLEVESDAENVYDDPFDSKGEKIKESKLLIDELDLPCDFLPPSEYDSFISQDFSRVDALPSTNKEDKIFNPVILIQEKPVEIITCVVQDKKLTISNASLVLEDFDPPFYEPLFFKEVPNIRGNVKTRTKGLCPPVFISSASIGNHPSGNPTFSSHLELTSPEVNNDIFDSKGCNVLSEKLVDLDSTKDLHPPLHDNPLSGSTICFSSSNPLLEEFADELPPKYDDNI